jgi:predicted MFS family arabinose efflux permease
MITSLSPKRELWLLLTLAGIQFTHIVDFMVMMPLGPQFTQLFHISDAKFGFLVSAYTFSAGLSGLLASFYVDRFSRKKLLLSLYTLFAVATLACGLAQSYDTLMLARIAAGAFGGVLAAMTQTIVADVIPFERRGRAMGMVMSAFALASVAGVPTGLFLAAHFSWHTPFFVIAAVCVLLVIGASVTLPPLADHLKHQRASPLSSIMQVLRDANHQKAFAFTALLMIAGFTVIPYITIYTTTNGGLTVQQVPYVYLLGGAATLFTARWVGRLTDSVGKAKMFKISAMFAMLAIWLVTTSAAFGLWGILLVTTLMFIGMNGRMIPGMALATSAANPKLRGTFMALNSSVQSAAMGLATFVGGLVISRDAQGLVQYFWVNALIAAVATLLSVLLVSRLYLYGAASAQAISPDAAKAT